MKNTRTPNKPPYSVQQLATLSGVSVRTLHHYDEIGLLPSKRSDNNYRFYEKPEIDRLQQIMLYREGGMALSDIKRLLDDASFSTERALTEHLEHLKAQRNRIDSLIASVEKTLATTKGTTTMTDMEKFEGFKQNLIAENEATYGKEARDLYGDEAVDASNAKIMGMTEEQYRSTQETEAAMKEALLEGMASGDPEGEAAQHAARLHRQWLCAFWKDGTYSPETHCGLADMYLADDRFISYYDAIAPGATHFLHDAIVAYCIDRS